MSSARLIVRAIVVTDGRAGQLPAVLASLAKQEVRPDIVHVALVGGAIAPLIPSELSVDVVESDATSYSEAIDGVLAAFPSHTREYLWLLHDDTAPLPDALSALSATARKRRQAAVVGGAHVRWDDTSKLVNLGTSVSRFGGRRVTMLENDDINQGQYDARDDVLAVSLAGALVRRDVWNEFGGFDAGFHGFGESAQYCRRAWMAGYDVVIVPTAKIRHSQESLYGRRTGSTRGHHASYANRRTSEWFHASVWARWWAVPLLVLWMFVSSIGRSAVRIAQNQPRMVGAEISVPWRLLGRTPQLIAARRASQSTSKVKRSVVRPLLASPLAIFATLRAREMGAYERARAAATPTDIVRADLDAARRRRIRGLVAVMVLGIGAAVVLFGTWIPSVVAGSQLSSRALGVTEFGWHDLWRRTFSGWSDQGFGAPTLDGTFAALLTPLGAMPGGTRLWIGLLLCFAVALAAASAWFAAGAATRSATVRALVALAYGVWPFYLQAIGDGRIGAVITHLALPWLVFAVARAVGWHRGELVGDNDEFPKRRRGSASAGVGAAVMLAVIAVATPVLLVPLTLVVVVVGAFAGRSRWRVWAMPFPAIVASGPAIIAAWQAGPFNGAAWHVLAREPGPSLVSPLTRPWELLLGFTGYYTDVPGLDDSGDRAAAMALGATIVVAALLALLSRRATLAVRLGFLVAAVGLLVAVAAQRSVVTLADGAGQADANGWAGAGSSLALIGLLIAAAAASHGVWREGHGTSRAVRRTASAVALAVAGLVLVGQVGVSAWPSRAPQTEVSAARADVLPLVAGLQQTATTQPRVLTLSMDEDSLVSYAVLTDDGSVWLTGRPARTPTGEVLAAGGETLATPQSLSGAVATLVGGGAGADVELSAWGIGVITVAPDSPRLEGALAQITDLQLMGVSTRGTSYAVARTGSDQPVSRAWFETADGDVQVLDSYGTLSHGDITGARGGRVVVAVPADPRWHASLDGAALTQVEDDYGRLAFAVEADAGTVDLDYDDGDYSRWWWAAAIVVAWSLLGSIPLNDRRYRAVR
ncbi:glycosyltransferase family 2 protein [Demequina aurantiaca]|uniref:glycosyltransferase family 2 protein n=1 Tax=Demequina aurantiaca TaxID=676200 RepID=UPI000783636E|nr:glycosyltransferase [Demequina aurantiaca]